MPRRLSHGTRACIGDVTNVARDGVQCMLERALDQQRSREQATHHHFPRVPAKTQRPSQVVQLSHDWRMSQAARVDNEVCGKARDRGEKWIHAQHWYRDEQESHSRTRDGEWLTTNLSSAFI